MIAKLQSTLSFCTLFDSKYITKGVALYKSLRRHVQQFRLWALCLDDATYQTLQQLALSGVEPISLDDLEKVDRQLRIAKQNRPHRNYVLTCKPALISYVLQLDEQAETMTYLDADLYFFSAPSPIYTEMRDHSAAFVKHDFATKHAEYNAIYGAYNSGFVAFRRDSAGKECLKFWRERCLVSCEIDRHQGRYLDQKYLEDMHVLFKGVKIISNRGAGRAPWNLINDAYSINGNNQVTVESERLIFFHFSMLERIAGPIFISLLPFEVRPSRTLVRSVYGTYLIELTKTERMLSPYLRRRSVPGHSLRLDKIRKIPQLTEAIAHGRWFVPLGDQVLWSCPIEPN